VLTVTLEVEGAAVTGCEWDIQFKLQTKLTYHGVLGDEMAGGIIFHTSAMIDDEPECLLDAGLGRRPGSLSRRRLPASLVCH
jgi:hypothetical protein